MEGMQCRSRRERLGNELTYKALKKQGQLREASYFWLN